MTTSADETIAELIRLGLTTYEAKAYVTLLGRDSFTAAQVARQGGLPRQRIYDVLRSLVERGLVLARPGEVAKYAAIAPDLALKRLLEEHRNRLAELERSADAMVDKLGAAYESGQGHTDPLEYIQVLRGAAVADWAASLPSVIEREILVFTKPPLTLRPHEMEASMEVVTHYRARSIYETGLLDDPEMEQWIGQFVEAGEEARFLDDLPLKLVIVDESVVMFGLADPVGDKGDLTTMVVEHPALARILKVAFEDAWARSLTLDEVRARRNTSA